MVRSNRSAVSLPAPLKGASLIRSLKQSHVEVVVALPDIVTCDAILWPITRDADFTLVDMQRRRRIEESWIVSPCGWTSFAGMDITGWPMATIVRGRAVMREDEVLGTPTGRLVRFAA